MIDSYTVNQKYTKTRQPALIFPTL